MTSTLVAFNAHPDDETLLTGGTLAHAAAEGWRVVLVTATRGEAGLAGPEDGTGEVLADRRMAELQAAAGVLGAASVHWLGYADSGLDGRRPDPRAFARCSIEDAARDLASLLWELDAAVLLGCDAHGGYGHPDHRQLHHVARRAAALAGTPRLLEASVPATGFRGLRFALRAVRSPLGRSDLSAPVFSRSSEITLRFRLDPDALDAKRRALRAHASQARGSQGSRTIDLLDRLPHSVAQLVLGREWYVDPRAAPGRRRELFPLM